jgi:hypothetical protein
MSSSTKVCMSTSLCILAALALSACATDSGEEGDVEGSASALLAPPTNVQIDEWARSNGFSTSAYPYYDAVNGCGSEPPTNLVPDAFYFVPLTEACNNHDRCYMTEGSSQWDCDTALREDIRSACRSAIGRINPFLLPSPSGVLRKHEAGSLLRCYAAADTYYTAVRAVGGSWHSNSQVEAAKYNTLVNDYISDVTTGSAWTQWLDRDDPTGNGDGEHLSLFDPSQVCPKPLLAECRRISDSVASTQTGESTVCNITQGGICINAEQSDGACDDYSVRFLCPVE